MNNIPLRFFSLIIGYSNGYGHGYGHRHGHGYGYRHGAGSTDWVDKRLAFLNGIACMVD